MGRIKNIERKPILFLDFDGTISKRDAIDLILERFADEKWKIIEEKWKSGVIGSRRCLREQVALIDAAPDEIDALLDEVELDEGFAALLETCHRHKIETRIISDGFDYCIERILSRASEAENLPIFSSHLEFQNGGWQTKFPYFARFCKHGCATCKPRVMRNLNPNNAPTIFVGDGLSDRYATQTADLIFAKKSLANYCAAEKIQFAAYGNLGDVAGKLSELLSAKKVSPHQIKPLFTAIEAQEIFG